MAKSGLPGDTNRNGANRGVKALALAGMSVFALLATTGIGVAFWGDPMAGEPSVRLALLRNQAASKPSAEKPRLMGVIPEAEPPPAATSGSITKAVYAGHALIADPDLIENTGNGPLPRIADDGRMPMHAYAADDKSAGRPRIALVISGLGISDKATAAALAGLPAGVTLGFAPYADNVQRWVSEARMLGHEVLLELPMEPFDYPDSDPGPHTLRAGMDESANTQRLAWALTRFTGYTGVTNLGTGGRFLSDGELLAPVMTFVARRGLLFFDNGAAPQSTVPVVAKQVGANFAQSDSSIDSIQAAMEIDRRLSALEDEARANGSAVGSGYIYPVTIDRVTRWADGLNGRGFVLVPVSAIVEQSK